MNMLGAGLNVIIDAQWGSTGKGKLAGWIGRRHKDQISFACSSFGPNAGHTYVDENGKKTVCKILPMAGVTAGKPCLIMPDSVISVEQLLKERSFVDVPVFVHPRTAILEEQDAVAARETGRRIAGTMQGTGHANSRKALRLDGVKLAKDVLPAQYVRDTCQMVRDSIKDGGAVVYEISQGFDLSLNHGHEYPYLCGRDITVGACLNGAGVPAKSLASVIGSMRTYPIRVGNVPGGWSGPHHPDQNELTWKEVASHGHGPDDLVEMTTVTKRVRRVFSFSMTQMLGFVDVNDPDALFVNFIQYLDWRLHKVRTVEELLANDRARDFIKALECELSVPVRLVGTGESVDDMVELP
jgi:adenylosuccinate synthase